MASLIAIEESGTNDNNDNIDKTNHNNDEQDNDPNPGTIRIESVDQKDTDLPDTERQPTVFKRAHTVMLTEEMQWFEDDYVKLEPLGEPGTFGMAFKCYKKTDPSTYYAVKQINKAKFYFKEQKGVLDNMKNEILIMKFLSNHPNICKLHETYEDRNYIFLILDFLSGGELYARIEELGELPEKQAQAITKQLLYAIKYMQQHNVAHLDLKPDNILFVNDQKKNTVIKIIDFGEAHMIENGEKLNHKIGTPYYMAPEIIREVAYDPFPADMWSVGVIIFCMLFGFVPFHAEEEHDIFEKIKQGFKNKVAEGYGAFFPADYPISEPAMDLISGLLTSSPQQRLTVDACLSHRWVRGNVVEIPKRISFRLSKAKKQHSMKKLFLIDEDPMVLSGSEYEEEYSDEEDQKQYIQISAPLNGIIKKGYLRKEGKLFKSWKKRYFMLQNNGIVSYYHSHNAHDLQKPIYEFNITHYTKLIASTKMQYGIILCTLQRNWKFICANTKQRNEWMRAFEQCRQNKQKERKVTLKINDKKMRVRKSFDERDANHLQTAYFTRTESVNKKIDAVLYAKMKAMMDDLEIPEARREEMLNLDQKQKIQLIQQHVFKKLNEKSKQLSMSASNSQSDSEKSGSKSPQSRSRNGYKTKRNTDMLHKKQSYSNDFKYDNSLQHIQTRAAASSFAFGFSLTSQSLALKRKQTSAKHSHFAGKHDKIMTGLVNAAKSRLNIIKNDKEIQQCVDEVFYVRELEGNDEVKPVKEMLARPSTARSAAISAEEFEEKLLVKASTIQFGATNPMQNTGSSQHKYVCRNVENVSFQSFVECIEFMLCELYQNQYSQQLYAKLIKRISVTHKCKLFSIGVERKDRRSWGKKYADCFVGTQGIAWLIAAKFVRDTADNRERAKDLANSFRTKGFLKHVVDDHKFKDEKLFYCFNDTLIDKQCLIEEANAMKHK